MLAYSNDTLTANNTCGIPPANSLHLFRGVHDDLPALGLTTGLTVMALYYWSSSQVILSLSFFQMLLNAESMF